MTQTPRNARNQNGKHTEQKIHMIVFVDFVPGLPFVSFVVGLTR